MKKETFNYLTYQKFAFFFLIIGCLVLIISTILFIASSSTIDTSLPLDTSIWNDYGGFISGTVGSLFSLVTILLVYLTYKAQVRELQDTREELIETRKITKAQSETLDKQQFENTYFKLLDNHVKLIDSFDGNLSARNLLNSSAKNLEYHIQTYQKYLEDKVISQLYYFSYHPLLDEAYSSELNQKIIYDIDHIGNFILSQKNFNEEEFLFYFMTLFNTLRNSEKYIYGLQSSLKVNEFLSPNSELINQTYNDYYNSLDNSIKLSNYTLDDGYPIIILSFANRNGETKSIPIESISSPPPEFRIVNKTSTAIFIGEIKIDNTFILKSNEWVKMDPASDFHFSTLDKFINETYFQKELENLIRKGKNPIATAIQAITQNNTYDKHHSLNILIKDKKDVIYTYQCKLQIDFTGGQNWYVKFSINY